MGTSECLVASQATKASKRCVDDVSREQRMSFLLETRLQSRKGGSQFYDKYVSAALLLIETLVPRSLCVRSSLNQLILPRKRGAK